MFINVNSFQVSLNGTNFLDLGPYLTQIEYQYNKIWSSDAGRNLAGTQTGTLVGIFPKFICSFRPLKQVELETLAPYLDAPTQKIKYYDPFKRATVTINTYTGDWGDTNKNIGQNEAFNISFIAKSKRV